MSAGWKPAVLSMWVRKRRLARLDSDAAEPRYNQADQCASTASSKSATMLVILIIGFTAGPAVSL